MDVNGAIEIVYPNNNNNIIIIIKRKQNHKKGAERTGRRGRA